MMTAVTWHDLTAGEDPSRPELRVWRTGALSLLVHVAAFLLVVPQINDLRHPGTESETSSPPLSVALVTPRVEPPARMTEAAPPPPRPPATRQDRPPPRTAIPPLAALPRVSPPEAYRVPPPVAEPLPVPRAEPRTEPRSIPMEADLSSYIAARRAGRGESPAGPSTTGRDSDAAKRERAIAENLAGLNEPRPLSGNPRSGGGLFQITLKSYDFAEFRFYGWNAEIQRQAPQRIEVRKDGNPSIDLAIVRRMIGIIRETQKGDFVWRTGNGRSVTLSARPEDNAALEDFLMDEMFGAPSRAPHG
jgi:hypothetical protein